MVLGRFKDAVSDVTETIRQAFRDPACRSADPTLARPGASTVPLLEGRGIGVDYDFHPAIREQELAFVAFLQSEPTGFAAALREENAWGTWAAGARVCEMALFTAGTCGRMEVPPLPRSASARRTDLPSFRCTSQVVREPLRPPGARNLSPRLAPPRVRRDLEAVLGLPIAIAGEDFQKLPKALNMRYTFQLVKATGENIRNLDVLGVYPVPVKGVAALRHDPRTGRILVNLDSEAVGAARGRFILARRKDDRSFVSCFVEE